MEDGCCDLFNHENNASNLLLRGFCDYTVVCHVKRELYDMRCFSQPATAMYTCTNWLQRTICACLSIEGEELRRCFVRCVLCYVCCVLCVVCCVVSVRDYLLFLYL